MTRAEWFAIHTGGWWAKCRVPFRCDHDHKYGSRCDHMVQHGDLYFDTNTAKYPDMTDTRRFIKRRLCFTCSYEVLEPVGQTTVNVNCPLTAVATAVNSLARI
jgi:hypothetical protein